MQQQAFGGGWVGGDRQGVVNSDLHKITGLRRNLSICR